MRKAWNLHQVIYRLSSFIKSLDPSWISWGCHVIQGVMWHHPRAGAKCIKLGSFGKNTKKWFLQIFQLEVKIDYVMSRVKLSKYVFRAYHSKGNLTLISNHMSIIHSTSTVFQITTFAVDEFLYSYMRPLLTPYTLMQMLP